MPVQCPNCRTQNIDGATFCSNCGTPFASTQIQTGVPIQQKICVNCQRPINVTFSTCPFCGVLQPTMYQNAPIYGSPYQGMPQVGTHSKVAAGLLGIFLGTLGIHKFYLGQGGAGILYILFCWTGVPSIVGFIEGIVYLTMSDQEFYYKYH